MAINVELLRKVQAAILAEPEHFNMAEYVNDCGTAACIGGWAVALSSSSQINDLVGLTSLEFVTRTQKELWLNVKQAIELFCVGDWPEEFRWPYRDAIQARRAQIACDRIDAFIKQYAPEAA